MANNSLNKLAINTGWSRFMQSAVYLDEKLQYKDQITLKKFIFRNFLYPCVL